MTKTMRYASYPPETSNGGAMDHHFAGIYAEGVHTGSRVWEKFPEADLPEIAEQVTHEELVHYLAFGLLRETGARWDFYAAMDPLALRTHTERRLFLPRLNQAIDIDDVAHRLQSEDLGVREAAREYWNSLQLSPEEERTVASAIWGDREKEIARKLQSFIDEAKSAAVSLGERWLEEPPVPGFDGRDFWSRENVTALATHGGDISDEDITLYFLGWLLGLTVGSSVGGRAGEFMLYPTRRDPSPPGLLPMVYLPDEESAINPRAFVMLRDAPQLADVWWQTMDIRRAPDYSFVFEKE